MRTEEARPIKLADYRPPDWLVDTVELDVRLHPVATLVSAKLLLRPNTLRGVPGPVVLDGQALSLRSIRLDGTALPREQYVTTADLLTITQRPQRPFRLEIETAVDPSANTQLQGLYRSGGTYCTQCEAEGFRRITYFPDRPDVMAVYTTRIEAEKADAPMLLANGNLVASGDSTAEPAISRSGMIRSPSPPTCSHWSAANSPASKIVPHHVGPPCHAAHLRRARQGIRCGHAMDSLKRAMRWDETAFGREYDLDIFMIVAVSDFNMGAMENKGLNIFNDKYVLATPETATDGDFDRIEAIIAHEYFHNWTGNRITCRDWFQLCLKEGLTVFRDQEFSGDERSRAVERISDVRGLRAHQFDEDAGPLAHPVRPAQYHEINNFYTATVYEKGAEVMRMLKTLLGPRKISRRHGSLFRRATTGRPRPSRSSCNASRMCPAVDLTQFMLWYSQAGTPEVVASGSYDARSPNLPPGARADRAADAWSGQQATDGDSARASAS